MEFFSSTQFEQRVIDRRKTKDSDSILVLSRNYIIARLYVTVSVFLSVMVALFDNNSLGFKSFEIANSTTIPLYIAIAFCLVGVFDIFVNDFLPNKYTFATAYNYRHLVYMILSLISFSISAGIIYTFGPNFGLGRLWLDGSIAAVVAILDIFARHKDNHDSAIHTGDF